MDKVIEMYLRLKKENLNGESCLFEIEQYGKKTISVFDNIELSLDTYDGVDFIINITSLVTKQRIYIDSTIVDTISIQDGFKCRSCGTSYSEDGRFIIHSSELAGGVKYRLIF